VRDQNEAKLRGAMESDAMPIDPHRLVAEVRAALPRDASVSVDGETIMGIARQIMPSYGERRLFNAGTTGCMGTGVPYAVGAKLARPEAPSVAIVGDYAFGAAALEVETAARVGAPVVFVVANNEGIAGHMIQDNFFPPDRRASRRSCPRTTRSSPSSSMAMPSASTSRARSGPRSTARSRRARCRWCTCAAIRRRRDSRAGSTCAEPRCASGPEAQNRDPGIGREADRFRAISFVGSPSTELRMKWFHGQARGLRPYSPRRAQPPALQDRPAGRDTMPGRIGPVHSRSRASFAANRIPPLSPALRELIERAYRTRAVQADRIFDLCRARFPHYGALDGDGLTKFRENLDMVVAAFYRLQLVEGRGPTPEELEPQRRAARERVRKASRSRRWWAATRWASRSCGRACSNISTRSPTCRASCSSASR
jgi:hypothetical protein